MSQKSIPQSSTTIPGVNMQSTGAYVKQMADELAKLAISAGCRQLFALLTLVSIEAETCTRGELPMVKKSDDALLQAPNLAT